MIHLLLLLSIIGFTSCTKDTCNSKLGDTFKSIETPQLDQDELGNKILISNMVTLDDLTEIYFEDAELNGNVKDRFGNEWQNDSQIIEKISFQKSFFELTFSNVDLVNFGKVVLHFRFGDRKFYIDCDHGGAGDTYFLDIEFQVNENSDGEMFIQDFSWEEDFKAGPF